MDATATINIESGKAQRLFESGYYLRAAFICVPHCVTIVGVVKLVCACASFAMADALTVG